MCAAVTATHHTKAQINSGFVANSQTRKLATATVKSRHATFMPPFPKRRQSHHYWWVSAIELIQRIAKKQVAQFQVEPHKTIPLSSALIKSSTML